jgi:hypothetical protein
MYLHPCGEVKARGIMAAHINDSHSQNISLGGGEGGVAGEYKIKKVRKNLCGLSS